MEKTALSAVPTAFAANGNAQTNDADAIERDVEAACGALLTALRIDWRNDHNCEGTPRRMARMYVREVCAGRFTPPPPCTDFPNVSNLDQLYAVGPIAFRSLCSHHFAPIIGSAWIGVLPSDRVLGLSKFARLVHHVASRPQIQEEATVQIADAIENAIKPLGLAVVVRASHTCMTWRGVKEPSSEMSTSVMRGILFHSPTSRAEFFSLAKIPS